MKYLASCFLLMSLGGPLYAQAAGSTGDLTCDQVIKKTVDAAFGGDASSLDYLIIEKTVVTKVVPNGHGGDSYMTAAVKVNGYEKRAVVEIEATPGGCFLNFLKLTDVNAAQSYCGKFRDNGDSFQIMDGLFNAYVDGAVPPKDPKGISKYLIGHSSQDKCFCLAGIIESYDRAGETAYSFSQLTSLKSCAGQPIIN